MNVYIKNVEILISAIYYFLKISKIKINTNLIFKLGFFTFIFCFFISNIDYYNSYFAIPFALIGLLMFLCINITVIKKEYVVIETVISFALGYILFNISTLLSAVICIMISENNAHFFGQIICFFIMLVLLPIPLCFNRFKEGMTFLKSQLYYVQGLVGSCLIIALSPLINNGLSDWKYVIFYLLFFAFSLLLFLYWRSSITRHYLERLSLRNIDSLNDELDEKNEYIKRLLEDKERLEKLNHKNYKFIPALQGAVMHYLEGISTFVDIYADNPAFSEIATAQEIDVKEFIKEGNSLMDEIKKMQSEWKEIVDSDDVDGTKEVPKCGVTRVDFILSYTYERSKKENFSFRVNVDSDLAGVTEKIISEEDLAILIADLIENAIIATKYNNGKDILVRMGIMKKEYVIEVYDSGTQFDKDVLLKYGIEKITTHADDNGSGIGMMQTYEILNKCGASLYIDELSQERGLFTKRISIVFNKKNQYVLYTKRNDDEVAYLHKRSDLMIIRK